MLIGGWTAYELYKSETTEERLDVMKATAHGFVWPAGIIALKFLGATNPILFVGNIIGAAYTFKDVPSFVMGLFDKKDEESELVKDKKE